MLVSRSFVGELWLCCGAVVHPPVFVGKMEVLILKGVPVRTGKVATEIREEGAWRPLLRHSTRDPPSPNSTDPGVEGSAFRILTSVKLCVFTGLSVN